MVSPTAPLSFLSGIIWLLLNASALVRTLPRSTTKSMSLSLRIGSRALLISASIDTISTTKSTMALMSLLSFWMKMVPTSPNTCRRWKRTYNLRVTISSIVILIQLSTISTRLTSHHSTIRTQLLTSSSRMILSPITISSRRNLSPTILPTSTTPPIHTQSILLQRKAECMRLDLSLTPAMSVRT